MNADLVRALRESLGWQGSSRSLDDLLVLSAKVGIDVAQLRRDIEALVVERISVWMLGEPSAGLNYGERLNAVRRRVQTMLPESTRVSCAESPLIQLLVGLQLRMPQCTGVRKEGIADAPEGTTSQLMKNQGDRCAWCGVPLASRAAHVCSRFPGGVEPVAEAVLDHVLPFYLGGNVGNTQLLCRWCNELKWDRIGVQEDGVVVCGNHLRSRGAGQVRRRMALWTIASSGSCGHEGCREGPRSSVMWVRRRSEPGPWTYGNLVVECSMHAGSSGWWLHEGCVTGNDATKPRSCSDCETGDRDED